jgi:hypothetical protein
MDHALRAPSLKIEEQCERHIEELQEAHGKAMLDYTIYGGAKRYAVAIDPHAESLRRYLLSCC